MSNYPEPFDDFPAGDLRRVSFASATGETLIPAPGAGFFVVILSAHFASDAVALVQEIGGAGYTLGMNSHVGDTVMPHNPKGWARLAENTGLETVGATVLSCTIIYKVVPT